VLGNIENEVFFVPKHAGVIEILTNRDPERRKQADEQRAREKMGGG